MSNVRCLMCLGDELMYLAEDIEGLIECPHCGQEVEE